MILGGRVQALLLYAWSRTTVLIDSMNRAIVTPMLEKLFDSMTFIMHPQHDLRNRPNRDYARNDSSYTIDNAHQEHQGRTES